MVRTFYRLTDTGDAMPCPMIEATSDWRIVTPTPEGRVSTLFLGYSVGNDRQGRPMVFETAIFGGPRDDERTHYATHEEASAGHWRIARVEAGVLPIDMSEVPW